MCKDMKKFPNSPPNRLPNSPHPLKKVKKSTSQQVYESTGLRVNEFWGLKSLLWVCLGLLGSVMGPKGPKSRTPI